MTVKEEKFMRDISPVKTSGVTGYYSDEDLVMQIMLYGDITPWRCARMMRIAEEERAKERMVLVLTENEIVSHLSVLGFLVYRPATHGFNASDIAVIIGQLQAGDAVVINTNELGDDDKYRISRLLVAALSLMDISRLSLVVESTEQFFSRRWNYGNKAGMPTLNNLLKRAKGSGAHMAFAAESPKEIAIEIANSCGTAAVGRVSNNDRATAVGNSVDKRLVRNANEMWGIKALNPNDFYLYNHTTAPRQAAAQGVLPIETPVNMLAMTQMSMLPCRLRDEPLFCLYDPSKPTPTPDLDGEHQEAFVDLIERGRDEADAEAERPAIAARKDSPSVSRAVSIANDNATAPVRRKAVRTRFTGASTAVAMIRAAGIQNADRYVTIGLKVVNARGGRLNAPLHGRLTPQSLATKVIKDDLLRDAIRTGFAVAHRSRSDKSTVISAPAYAAAFYHALGEDQALARRFHAEMFVEGVRSGKRSPQGRDLDAAMRQIGTEANSTLRSEAQYQLLRNAWILFQNANRAALPKAA